MLPRVEAATRALQTHPNLQPYTKDASFLLTVEVFLLTVRLFYLRRANRKEKRPNLISGGGEP